MDEPESIEISAKTIEAATAEAFSRLKISKDEAKVSVLDPGGKGFFGIGAKPARVRVEIIFDPEGKAKKFLRELAVAMGVSVDISTEMKDRSLYINISGSDMGVFIGKRGQTLDSLQYLVNLALNKGHGNYTSVVIDSENYRQRRKETLEALSLNLAKKVKSTQRSVILEPMTSSERRIIHSTLQNDKYVSTYSEGEEPFRNVVIAPKKGAALSKKPYSEASKGESRKNSK